MNTAVREKWISLINVGWVAQCEICKVVVAFGRTKNQVDLAAGRHLDREHPSLTVEGEA